MNTRNCTDMTNACGSVVLYMYIYIICDVFIMRDRPVVVVSLRALTQPSGLTTLWIV